MPTPKKHRRAKGTGSIFWSQSRKRYIGRVPVGRNLDGSTCYVTVSDRNEAVCAAKMRDARRPDPRQTVAEWAERWHKELTIRDSSRDDYRHTLDNFIIPTLGHLPITALTSHQIEAAIKRWMIRLGPNTARKNFGHLRACLEAARRAGLIPTNPAKDARRPKPKKSHIDPFTAAELDRIIQTAPPVFVLLASVGCRIGEALALDVPDLNRETGWISITKTYTLRHGIRRPKSENGIREVRIPAQAMPAILAAAGPRTSGPLFVTRRGVRGEQGGNLVSVERLAAETGAAVSPSAPATAQRGLDLGGARRAGRGRGEATGRYRRDGGAVLLASNRRGPDGHDGAGVR